MHLFKYLVILLILAGCTSGVKKEKQTRSEFPESYLIAQDSSPVFDSVAIDRFLNTEKKANRYSDEIRDFYRGRPHEAEIR